MALIIIDEIHLLGNDRGPVLEVIVSRAAYITAHTTYKVRIVGLSTALSNAHDLANWLTVPKQGIVREYTYLIFISIAPGLFNFRPSVRPVPMEVHIQGNYKATSSV